MKLEMAEAMAYNRQCLGFVVGLAAARNFPESAKRYHQFFHKNFQLFRGIESAVEVAVLHSFSALAFNNDGPYQSTWLFEQALIQAKVPFDIIFDQRLKDLSKYRASVLADQECLSDEKLDLIRGFVNHGGWLVATEWTSLHTEWRELRPGFGMADLFQAKPAESWVGGLPLVVGEKPSIPSPVRNQVGDGRVVYLAEVKAAKEKPATVPIASEYWKLPVNWLELIEAVRWGAGGELALEVKTPLTVTADLLRQRASGAFLIHLVNYDVGWTPAVENIEV
jgi:hypothetical protein